MQNKGRKNLQNRGKSFHPLDVRCPFIFCENVFTYLLIFIVLFKKYYKVREEL